MKIKLNLFLFYLSILLSACASGGTPRLIASHATEIEPIAIQPIVPAPEIEHEVIYNSVLDLEVSNVDRAAEDAVDLASEYGGFLVNSSSWMQGRDKHTTLVLAIPTRNYEVVHNQLIRIGDLIAEQVYGDLIPAPGNSWEPYSHITVNLQPAAFSFPPISMPNWRPARTFLKAWGVFTSIFGFILDIAIWMVVVLGPFALLAWGTRALIRWRRKGS